VSALWADTPLRGRVLAAVLLAAFLAAPLIADRYLISVLILVLYFAYVGQAWNLLMGFAGQLSLGHALYLGIGAYVAAALWIHFGVGPWLGVFAAIPIAALGGAFIGWLGWRFSIEGVYFALLTIALPSSPASASIIGISPAPPPDSSFPSAARRRRNGGTSAAVRCCSITSRSRSRPGPPGSLPGCGARRWAIAGSRCARMRRRRARSASTYSGPEWRRC